MTSREPVKDNGEPAAAGDQQAGPGKERGGIQSIERAFSILEAIARKPNGIGLGELSREVGLHNSTTFNLAKTMVSLGYVHQDPVNKTYTIGRPIYALAASAIHEVQLVKIAYPLLEELNRETGELSHLAVRSGEEIIIVAKTDGHSAFDFRSRVGMARPAHCTAVGKILLAALPDAELDRWLGVETMESYTENTITDPDRLREDIERVRANDVAYDDEEFHKDVRCVAVPVHDFTGQTIAAVGISGPIWRLSLPVLTEVTRHVREVAERLSRELGYAGPEAAEASDDATKEGPPEAGRRQRGARSK